MVLTPLMKHTDRHSACAETRLRQPLSQQLIITTAGQGLLFFQVLNLEIPMFNGIEE